MSQWCGIGNPLLFDQPSADGVRSTGSSRSQTEPALDPFNAADRVSPPLALPYDAPVITPTITYSTSEQGEENEEEQERVGRGGTEPPADDREWWERIPWFGGRPIPEWGPYPSPNTSQPAPQGDYRGVPAEPSDVERDDGVLRGPAPTQAPPQSSAEDPVTRRSDDADGFPQLPYFVDYFGDDDDEDSDMDLGNILGGVRNAVDTYRYVNDTLDPRQPTIGSRVDALFDGDPDTTITSPLPARSSAKASKGCRRRRRRLLTKSDLGDIAALKGVVGMGKNFDNILAAAMYRSR